MTIGSGLTPGADFFSNCEMTEISITEFNSADAQTLSRIFSAGTSEDAARWLHTAAEHGVVEAQVHYAQMLLDGRGVEANPQEAFQWFRLAARQGHAMARNMLGRCYENGWGVEPDMLLATYWFRLAAQSGLDWGMYNYATSLALGRGVGIDRKEALVWLQKATALGHAKSWNLMGGFFEDGWACEPDVKAALACYRKAAEGGDFRGQFNVGRLLAAAEQFGQALTWFRAAYHNPGATEAFRNKMRRFLNESPHTLLRNLGQQLS